MKLYEITDKISFLNNTENYEFDEIDLEYLQENLDKLNLEFDEKIDNITRYIKNLESDVNEIKNEILRLSNLRVQKLKKIDFLKEYIKSCMTHLNKKRVENSLFKISIRKSPPSINILDEYRIPDKYKNEKIEINIDKKQILSDIKETGEIPPGIEIKQKEYLYIK